jgi:hypothetical protein
MKRSILPTLVLAVAALTFAVSAWAADITLKPIADSPIFGSSPGSNYGSNTYGYWGYYNNPMRTLVKYDCSTVSGTVTAVKLSFQLMQNNWLTTTRIWGCKLLADWQEMTVTYANQPAHDDTGAGRFLDQLAVSGLGPFNLDCTTTANSIVQAWISSPSTNYGIILRTQTEGNQERAYPYMKESSAQPINLIVTVTSGVAPTSFGKVKALYR